MKNMFFFSTKTWVAMAAGALLLSSCVKDPNEGKAPHSPDAYFSFTTTRSCPVSINYGFTNDYSVTFELYDENPLTLDEETQSMVKTTQEPLYRGSTDGKGAFADDVVLPASVKEVYLYSDYPGTVGPVKLTVGDDGKIAFDVAQLKSRAAGATRAQTSAGYNYPDRYRVLGGWTASGRPDYLLAPASLSAQQLYDLKAAFNLSGADKIQNFPQADRVADDVNIRVDIKKATTIKLVFITTTASMCNAIGYYTYPTGQEPTDPSQIEPIIAFPHISSRNCNTDGAGSLFTGDQVQLKYWNKAKGVFEDEFPAGISIGWFIGAYMFDTNTSALKNGTPVYYATRTLNQNSMHRSIAFNDNVSGRMVAIGFEDSGIKTSGEGNFCDAAFFLDYGDPSAAETGGTGTLPDAPGVTEEDNYHVVSGTLAFEDLWPSQGDYDMNDLVVDYHSTVYKNVINNRATKVVDRYTVAYIGGTFLNGFGYSMDDLTPAQISKVSIESPGGTTSAYMQGAMLEPGQEKPTVILFDNAREVLGQTFTVTTEFSYPVKTSLINAPYNPFTVIKATVSRGREVHLPKYPPTQLADPVYFGTGSDRSDPEQKLYYVSGSNFPFAINIPGQFKYPTEKVRIDQAYPDYTKWVKSGGKTNIDWYKKPAF